MYYFRGFSNSLLSFDKDRSEWKLTLDSNSETYATCNESIKYPFGTHNWYFYNDNCKSTESEYSSDKDVLKLPINFNGCNSEEFNCADGSW